MNDEAKQYKRILYGRRRGHKLRDGWQALVDQLLPHLAIDLPETDASDGLQLDQADLFTGMADGKSADMWLELGFGGGEHLAAKALSRSDIAFIGCEPFINGVASLLRYIERDGLQNIRIWQDDAWKLMSVLPTASVARSFLLYPDPWPKTRHARRRFISTETLDQMARILRDDAEFFVATDHPVYCRWALSHLQRHPDFDWTACRADDWKTPPADWPGTRYEAKAIKAGRVPSYLSFVRKPRNT